MINNNSLPIGFEKLKTEKPYIQPGKLTEGEHRFRIVQRPIGGWIDWKDNKPHRFKPDAKPKVSFDAAKPMKPFWALHVWDYEREGLFILDITQNSIRKTLEDLALNEDWGDLTSFDIKIKKEGSGIDTEYKVIPVPPRPMNGEIKAAVALSKVRLEALYEGKDPWADTEAMPELPAGDFAMLTDDQVATLMQLTSRIKDNQYLMKFMVSLGVNFIGDIDPKDFERTVKELESTIRSEEVHHGTG